MKRIVFLLAAFSILSACNKNILDAISSNCEDLVSSDPGGFVTESYLDYRYFYPCYNPGDSSMFSCIRMTTADSTYELYIYNTATGVGTVMATCTMDIAPRWGKRGWLLYSDGTAVHRINEEGDKDFLAFSDSYVHTDIDWDRTGEFLISHYNTGTEEGTMLSDLDGIIHQQTTDVVYSGGSYYPCKTRFAYSYATDNLINIAYFDTTDMSTPTTFTSFKNLGEESVINSIVWFKNQQDMVWTNGTSVGVSNINNGNTRIFMDNCNAKTYMHPSISGGGDKFLFETRVATKISETELLIENRIVEMNLDGTGEVDVLF